MASEDVLLAQAASNTRQTIRFTITFNVTREAGSYNRIITDIRRQVAMPNRYIANVPVLNPEEGNRNIWFQIILIANDSQITLRIRYGDMYLIGFQTSFGQWYEFSDNIEHFDGAILLPWRSDYPTNRAVHEAVTVGRDSLIRAIERLADYNPQNRQENQNALYCLMTMFPEALRYTSIENFVYERIHRSRDDPIGVQLVNQVRNWGSLSREMRRSDLFATFRELATLGIGNAQDAAAILGLILFSTKTPRPPRAINVVSEVITKGRELVEIFWVQILNIDDEDPGDLYGTIRVVDGLATPQYIFSQDRSSPLSIGPKEYLPLVGPTRAISAFDSFYIDVSLMDYDALSPDDEVSRGQITWNYYENNIYNQPLSAEVKGKYGSIAVGYAVYSNAVTATVQVTLINGDNEDPANVYGKIDASNTFSNEGILIFNKTDKEYVNIRPGEMIPLLRSVVVVPLNSSIKVVADLWDEDTLSPDDSIAKGSVTLVAADSGSSTGTITGKYGLVEVKITWSSNWA